MPLSRKRSHHARPGKTLGHGVRPLVKRLTQAQIDARAARLLARSTFRQEAGKMIAMAIGRANTSLAVLQRGFWGRVKWLLRGR